MKAKLELELEQCPALKSFIEYWDEWHKEWYALALKLTPSTSPFIDCWEFPTPIWRFFPEPYWGNPYADKLVAVFLNINPGAGGEDQDIFHIPEKDPIKTYTANSRVYSRTVEILSADNDYKTTDYFRSRRVDWLKKLLECLKRPTMPDLSVQNIFCADLIPWHSPTVDSFVTNYIDKHRICIVNKIIDPIAALSQCAELKGLVFAKGAVIELLLIKLVGDPIDRYYNGDYRISIFEYKEAKIIVLIGGQGMRLPNPCNVYENSAHDSKKTIAEIVANLIKETEILNNNEKKQASKVDKDDAFNTVIVPVCITIADIRKNKQYLCPLYRPLKKGILYIAFYIDKEIVGYGKIISSSIDSFGNIVYQLDGFHPLNIPHIGKGAYVQNRKYCSITKLLKAKKTSEI
jgi:hypothetical protein